MSCGLASDPLGSECPGQRRRRMDKRCHRAFSLVARRLVERLPGLGLAHVDRPAIVQGCPRTLCASSCRQALTP